MSLPKGFVWILLAAATAFVAGCGTTPSFNMSNQLTEKDETDISEQSEPLRALADKRGILIGSAISLGALKQDPAYGAVAAREFNVLTPENEMKWGPIHPERNRYDFSASDELVAFAQAHKMAVHGHWLVCHGQNPDWLDKGTFSREEYIGILRDHITTVVSRYKGRVAIWDVVNEAVENGNSGALRKTLWQKGIGDDYLELAFRMAHEADPDAILIYNDYAAENINAKSDGIYRMVKAMKKKGVPIHGIGFQMHVPLTYINLDSFAKNLQRFADLGLKIYITEMDVRLRKDTTPEKLDAQAKVYGDILAVCLAQKACKGFQTWGFTDKYSWIPSSAKGFDDALIFDREYNPKPAYQVIRTVLKKSQQAERGS